MGKKQPNVPQNRLTEGDLLALQERARAATPGPWSAPGSEDEDDNFVVLASNPEGAAPVPVAHTRWPLTRWSPSSASAARNAEFIAASRDMVPKLLAEISQLRWENRLLKSVASHARSYLTHSQSSEREIAHDLSSALVDWEDRGSRILVTTKV